MSELEIVRQIHEYDTGQARGCRGKGAQEGREELPSGCGREPRDSERGPVQEAHDFTGGHLRGLKKRPAVQCARDRMPSFAF